MCINKYTSIYTLIPCFLYRVTVKMHNTIQKTPLRCVFRVPGQTKVQMVSDSILNKLISFVQFDEEFYRPSKAPHQKHIQNYPHKTIRTTPYRYTHTVIHIRLCVYMIIYDNKRYPIVS